MKPLKTAIVALLIFLGGCVRSINPIYTDDTLATDASLAGTWSSAEGDRAEVTLGAGEKAYRVTLTNSNGKVDHLLAMLTRLDDRLVADFTIDDSKLPDAEVYQAHLQPLHSFFFVEKTSDGALSLRTIDGKWLRAYLTEHPDAVPHQMPDDENDPPLLTGSTAQVRALLEKIAAEPGAMGEPMVYRRVPATTAPAAPASEP